MEKGTTACVHGARKAETVDTLAVRPPTQAGCLALTPLSAACQVEGKFPLARVFASGQPFKRHNTPLSLARVLT